MLVVLIGKSASGKDTILRELVKRHSFKEIVTTTTRPMREGEVNGVDYNFISKEDFEKGIRKGNYFEYRSYSTLREGKPNLWYYGTPKMILDETCNYVTVVDVQGAKDYSKYFGKNNCYVVQIIAPEDVRTQRAMQRGSFDKSEWSRRLKADDKAFSEENTRSTSSFEIACKMQNDNNTDTKEIADSISNIIDLLQ